jgi:hypothetical protein
MKTLGVFRKKQQRRKTKTETMAGAAVGWRVIIGAPFLVLIVFLSHVTTVEAGRLGNVQKQPLLQQDQPQQHRQLQVTRHTSNATTVDNVFDRAAPRATDNDNEGNSTASRGTDSAAAADVVAAKQQQQGSSLCSLNDKGLFGDANAARNSGARAFDLQYLYQLYLAPGTATLNNEVLALDVDRAIVTAILPDFFDCRESSTRLRRMLLRQNRALQGSNGGGGTIESISALPVDLLVQPRNCKLPRRLFFSSSVSLSI